MNLYILVVLLLLIFSAPVLAKTYIIERQDTGGGFNSFDPGNYTLYDATVCSDDNCTVVWRTLWVE